MYFEYTKKQGEVIANITGRYMEIWRAESEEETSEEEKLDHLRQIGLKIEKLEKEYDQTHIKFETEAFNKLSHEPEALLDHARDNIPLCISEMWKNYDGLRINAINRDDLADKRIFVSLNDRRGSRLCLRPDIVFYNPEAEVREARGLLYEMRLHIKALEGNKKALDTLLKICVKSMIKSNYVALNSEDEPIVSSFLRIYKRFITRDIYAYFSTPKPNTGIYRGKLKDPQKIYLPNSRQSNNLLSGGGALIPMDSLIGIEGNGQYNFFERSGQQGSNKATVTLSVIFNADKERLTKEYQRPMQKTITADEYFCLIAIGTMFMEQNDLDFADMTQPVDITAREIWCRMNGKNYNDPKNKPSPKQLREVVQMVETWSCSRAEIDITDEVRTWINNPSPQNEERLEMVRLLLKDYTRVNFENGERLVITDNMLHSRNISLRLSNGVTAASSYRILSIPVYFSLILAEKYYLVQDFRLLDIGINSTKRTRAFIFYLLKEITRQKNGDKRRDSHYLISTLLESVQIPTPEERADKKGSEDNDQRRNRIKFEKSEDRKIIKAALDSWVIPKDDTETPFILRAGWLESSKNGIYGFWVEVPEYPRKKGYYGKDEQREFCKYRKT